MLEYISEFSYVIIKLFLENPWGQSFWLIAFIISIINFTFMKNRWFIWWTLFASLFWWFNFYLLWAFAAAYINFFDVFKNWAALMWKKSKKVFIFFLASYILIWFFQLYSSYIENWMTFVTIIKGFIPTITALLSTYLVFKTTWIKMKTGFLIVVALWFIYNLYFNNIWWILTDLSLWIMWLVWIWKDVKDEKTRLAKKML